MNGKSHLKEYVLKSSLLACDGHLNQDYDTVKHEVSQTIRNLEQEFPFAVPENGIQVTKMETGEIDLDGFDRLVEQYGDELQDGGYLKQSKREKLERDVEKHFDRLSGSELTIAEEFNEYIYMTGLING